MESSPTIIYEDDEILVINKPSGLVVHGDGRTEERSVADWLVEQYPNMRGVGEPWENQKGETIERPGIVHRLDRETSGIMVVAKTQKSFEILKEQFKERDIKKAYRAFAYDSFKEEDGDIERTIGKSKSDFRMWSAQPGSRGVQREAHTAWEVLGRTEKNNKKYTYLELTPTTGRTHQLRVHLKAIHHPIVCDKLYAPKRGCALGFKRLALHARTITIPDRDAFAAPYPEDFLNALKEIEE